MTKPNQQFTLTPIGKVTTAEDGFNIEIYEPCHPALKQLNQFSHVIVIWWANQHDNKESRNITQTTPPYANKLTGVFACRAEYRPNPIAITTCAILDVDEQKGIVKVPWIDAYDGTPVLDLKAYFPVSDRVKDPHIPKWLANWPQWIPDSDFDPEALTEESAQESGKLPTSGRIGRLAETIAEQTSIQTAQEVFEAWNQQKIGKSKDPEKIQNLMVALEQKVGKEKAIEIMHECGRKCYDSIAYLQKSAEELKNKHPASLQEHVKNLNKKFASTSKIELTSDNTLIYQQLKCYCMVKNPEKPLDNKNYCQCGVGCRQKFFEAIFEKPVKVELLESIATGGESCKFLIKP
ncbi:MAG: TrmO family methyltransferase [Candidatus Bathyarchaeota archaeon]|nr:TrmO family methyltransferase [Candidatus Bathyarchaeota archaeon]